MTGSEDSKVVILSDASFAAETAQGLCLVDFWAEWCGPCRQMIPRLEELSKKMDGKARIMKINVDENPMTPTQFGVRGIPAMYVFVDGKKVDEQIGTCSVVALEEKLSKYSTK